MSKKLFSALLALAIMVSCAACGSNNSSSSGSNPSGGNNVGGTSANNPSGGDTDKPFAGQTVRVTAWGGSYEETLRNLVVPKFEAETGAKVEIILGSAPIAQLKAEGEDPSVDVMHLSYYEFESARILGVSGELDYANMSNAADLYDSAKASPYGVITNWGNWSYAYRNDLVENVPTSWADLWNDEYAGKLCVGDINTGAYELAEMTARTFCDNKSLTDKSTWDTVFEKFKELAPNTYLLADGHEDLENALLTGDAVIAVNPNGRTARLISEGNNNISFATLKEGTPGMPTYVAVSKYTKVPELAQALVNELIGVDAEYAYAVNNFYAPSNRNCELPKELQDLMPYGEDAVNNLIFFDQSTFTEEERSEFIDRFNQAFKNR